MSETLTSEAPAIIPVPDGVDDETADQVCGLYREGIVAKSGALSRAWARQLAEDIDIAFAEALGRPNGAVGRGPKRYHVEVYPEQMRGFVELVEHPWVRSLCAAVLGQNYQIVEVGFDVPLAGAQDQPWHRDFPMPEDMRRRKRLTSLALNATAVDTEEDMGPFEIAPGTQWDWSEEFDHGMFPPRSLYPRYEARAVRKFPKMGDISARSALTIHRGTQNLSPNPRPVLVLGVIAPGAAGASWPDLAVSRRYWERLPERVRDHLVCPVVEVLKPIRQKKNPIEGMMVGEA
jgi:hypothetical protein